MNNLHKTAFIIYVALGSCLSMIFLIIVCSWSRFFSNNGSNTQKQRLTWGSTPIINYAIWSKAMSEAGYISETNVNYFFENINSRSSWDNVTSERFKYLPSAMKKPLEFALGIIRYDVFFISFDGYFLGNSPLANYQHFLFKLAKKKVVVLPYGSDAYVYSNIKSTSIQHALNISYPESAKNQIYLRKRVEYWVKYADIMVPGLMGFDGIGRWDVLIPSGLFIDCNEWTPQADHSGLRDGRNLPVRITHAPNHRGFKGTEFLLEAVKKLQKRGLLIELQLLEGIPNERVKEILSKETDLLVEQLIFTGHGMNALEGMACGVPTISNLEDKDYVLPMERWTYFKDCPLVSASPENILDKLEGLITNPKLRERIGDASRNYVLNYHDMDSAVYLFSNIIEALHTKDHKIIDLYNPLKGYTGQKQFIIDNSWKNELQ